MAVFPEGYPWNDMTDWFRDESAAGLFFTRRPAYGILLLMQHAGRAAGRGERIPLLDCCTVSESLHSIIASKFRQ